MAKSPQIAVIQFPGINTEVETCREINRAGMKAHLVRWNERASTLKKFDGFVIGGGFSFEDRVRAGIIASLEPIMQAVKEEAARGKAVLGICNGAQIVVESGLIPGITGEKLAMALARNKRVQDGKVLGTGYYNAWVKMKCVSKRALFTQHFEEDEIIDAPIAHAEGRFTSELKEMLEDLHKNGQMVFRYCGENGAMSFAYPTNPNGAVYNLAAVCNPAGNVMAVMPHLERAPRASAKLFEGMRDAILERKQGDVKGRIPRLNVKPLSAELSKFEPEKQAFRFTIELKITDNTAETVNITLQRLGFENVSVARATHVEVVTSGKVDSDKLAKKLIKSGVLMNTNKEVARMEGEERAAADDVQSISLLVRDTEDFLGAAKTATLRQRLKMSDVTEVRIGTLWTISISTKSTNVAEQTLKKLLDTHIFFNPHSQRGVRV